MKFPGNPRLSPMAGENSRGIHNSHSFDNPRVTDPQVRQALWGRVRQGHRAMPGGHRSTSSLGPAAGPVQGPPSSRQRQAQATRSAGGQRKGAAHCDPFHTFPAQPATAGVPETREAGSSKTSRSERPQAWELKHRPKPRVARRQHDRVRELSLYLPHTPMHQGPTAGGSSAAGTC